MNWLDDPIILTQLLCDMCAVNQSPVALEGQEDIPAYVPDITNHVAECKPVEEFKAAGLI